MPADRTASSADPACVTMADQQHAWNRGLPVWQILFWFFVTLGLLITYLSDDVTPAQRAIATGAVGVLALAFAVIRPRATEGLTVRNDLYLLIAITAVGIACAAVPGLSLLLSALFPQMWLYSGTTRAGAMLSGALSLSALLGLLSANHWSGESFWTLGTVSIISLAFSIGIGIWISRIIDQSRERADLISELEAARSELGAAHHAQGVMAERERMAREIHDTLAQGFTSVIMLSQSALAELARSPAAAADRLASIEDVARENLAEARALVAAFAPAGLDGSTLVDALRRLADRFAAETGLAVALDLPPALSGLSRDREVVLLRAVQESLANVRRHAEATSVTVRLTVQGEDAQVEVTDNGVGFAVSTAAGFGLTGMRHRVQEAGGQLDVDSSPGTGTRVVVRLPSEVPQ